MRRIAPYFLVLACVVCVPLAAQASGGPLGIDHPLHYDDSGIWAKGNQKALEYGAAISVVGGALWFGDQDKLGDTFWRSLDSLAVSSLIAEGGKLVFQRERPSQTNDPDAFFKGTKYGSFPSGSVTVVSSAITPFVVAYGHDHPAVYALELLPLYEATARLKVHAHWQSDVLVGWAIGTGVGIWAAHRKTPLILGWLPGGFQIGFVHRF